MKNGLKAVSILSQKVYQRQSYQRLFEIQEKSQTYFDNEPSEYESKKAELVRFDPADPRCTKRERPEHSVVPEYKPPAPLTAEEARANLEREIAACEDLGELEVDAMYAEFMEK